MSQHDLILDNASGAGFRADANAALAALGSTMKGPNAPPAPIAGMMWMDDDTPSASVWTLKIYDGAEWLTVGTIDTSGNGFAPEFLPAVLRAVAGSVSAPGVVVGASATGLHSQGAGYLDLITSGRISLSVRPDSVILQDGNPSDSNIIFSMRSGGASASNERGFYLSALNENSVSLANILQNIKTDGSSSIELYTTPPGSRVSDRRAVRMVIPGSGPVVVNSGGLDVNNDLRFNSGYGSAALAFGVRAWVNFNGTGTVAVRGSGAVTSITDNGAGDYTVNFNFTMPGTNYAATVSAGNAGTLASTNATIAWPAIYSTTSLRIGVSDNNADTNVDVENVNVIVVR